MTLTVGDSARFDGPGCAEVPWTFSYTKQTDRAFELYVKARQPGSNSTIDWYYDRGESDPDAATKSATVCFDQYDVDASGGPFQVAGTLEVRDDNWTTLGEVPMSVSGSVTPVRNRSRFTRLRVKAGTTISDLPMVKGKVVARTLTHGWLGADGDVVIEGKVRGKWHVAFLNRRPLGPGDSWKTGQRVPASGPYVDQYGSMSYFEAGATFSPTIGASGDSECAFRTFVDPAEPEAA